MQDEEQRPLRAGDDVERAPSEAQEPPALLPEPPPPAAPPPPPPPAHPPPPPGQLWDERGRTTLVVNLASIMERVDEQLLPALYSRVGASFAADPEQARRSLHPPGFTWAACCGWCMLWLNSCPASPVPGSWAP